jgi:competence protein ComEC
MLLSLPLGLLKADILVAPHHGSATSSTAAFLDAVQPRYGLFSVGYRNRFGFPHWQVVRRYRERGAKLYATATSGAIRFELGTERITGPSRYRLAGAHFWNIPAADVVTERVD